MLTEKQFQQQITDMCDWLGLRWYHTHDSRRSPSGFPDLVIVGSDVLYVELKSHKGRVSKAQQEWIVTLIDAGQRAYVWRPDDFEWAKQTLFVISGRRTA